MDQGTVIEQMKLSERDSVLTFLAKVYSDNPRQSDREFWDWHFLEAPNNDSDDLPVWLAKSSGRIVGQLAAIPVKLEIHSQTVPAIFILDLIVDPDFRRRGIARKLAIAAREFCPFVLGVNTTKQKSTEVLEGLDFVVVSPIPRFQRILFPGNALPGFERFTPLRSISNAAFAPFRPRTKGSSHSIHTLRSFDPSFDALWHEARSQWGCAVQRTAAMLDWQFMRQPGKKFDILGAFAGDKLIGYAILFFRRANRSGAISKAAITDICYHPSYTEVVDDLVNKALEIAVERRAGGLVTDTLDDLLIERLRRLGFWQVKSGLQLLANAPSERELLYDRNQWFITRGDSDISIFEDPNL